MVKGESGFGFGFEWYSSFPIGSSSVWSFPVLLTIPVLISGPLSSGDGEKGGTVGVSEDGNAGGLTLSYLKINNAS